MDTKPPELPVSVPTWKRIIVTALVWGFGCGLALSGVLVALYFYTQRPKVWDTHALTSKNVKAESMFKVDDKYVETSSGVIFTADLENATSDDITLAKDITVMQSTKGSQALTSSVLKLESDYFLPAHHVRSITLDDDSMCAAKVDPQSCFDRYFKDVSDIVLFDDSKKLEIHIPIPTFTSPK